MKSVLKTIIVCLVLASAVGAAVVLTRGPVTVPVVHPARGPAVTAVYATGTVEPTVMFPVAPRNPGRIVALYADESDKVAQGQIMAQLEDEDLRNTLAGLQAKLDLAQKDYERKQKLIASGAVSAQILDAARAEVDADTAAVQKAQVDIGYMKLAAPDAGTVIRRDGETGQLIPANQPIFWLSCLDCLRVSAEVDEEDIATIIPGQKVVIRADAFPGETFDGTVQSVTPKGDPVARSYRVRIALPADTKMMIGMTAETNIVINETDDSILLPASAVGKDSVKIISDGKISERKVETGARGPDAVEIKSGVGMDDTVALDYSQDTGGRPARPALKSWSAPGKAP